MSLPPYLAPLEVPLTAGKINEGRLEAVVNELIDSGVAGIIVNSRMLALQIPSDRKREGLIKLVSGYVGARQSDVLVIADVTRGDANYPFERMSTLVKAEAGMVEQAGATHVLMYPFYYDFLTNKTFEEDLLGILGSLPLPFIVANDPQLHHVTGKGNINVEHLERMAWNKHVYGVMDNSGSDAYWKSIGGMDMPADFKVFQLKPKE